MLNKKFHIVAFLMIFSFLHLHVKAQKTDSCRHAFISYIFGNRHVKYTYFIYEDSLDKRHFYVTDTRLLQIQIKRNLRKGDISKNDFDKIMIRKFTKDSVLSYKEFGPIKPMWKIENMEYVNEFYKKGRDWFLKQFCAEYGPGGGRLKQEYQSYSIMPTVKYFPHIVVAAYRLGIVIGQPEEHDEVIYISNCK